MGNRYLQEGTSLIGRYTIQSILGAGGFGITYKAHDKLTQQTVAIKEYFPVGMVTRNGNNTISITSSEYSYEFDRGKQRFLSEAQDLLKFKDSPSIVSVQNFFEENATAYMAMEYLEGCTLAQYTKNMGGKLDVDTALYVMDKMMIALEEIHNAGIIHRDISPDNIYMMNDKSVKLIDFGAAKQAYCGETQNLSIMLKPGYAPPEQYANNTPQGAWTDIYAFGATMYRLITGTKPPESVSRIFQDDYIVPVEIDRNIPVYLSNAISIAMEVKPENRFHNIAEFRNAVFGNGNAGQNNLNGEAQTTVITGQDKSNEGFDGTVLINSNNNGNYVTPTMLGNQQNMGPMQQNMGSMQNNFTAGNMNSNTISHYSGNVSGKKNKGLIIAIICLVLCLVGGGIFAVVKLSGDKKDSDSKDDKIVAGKDDDKDVDDKDDDDDDITTELTTQATTQAATHATTQATTELTTEATTTEVAGYVPEMFDFGLAKPDPNSDEKVTIYARNDLLNQQYALFLEKYPEYKDRIIIDTSGAVSNDFYLTEVYDSISKTDGADIILLDSDCTGALEDTSAFMSVEDLGITSQMYANAYDHTKKWATYGGKLMALTFQTEPGVVFYRNDIAKEVFGTDNPDEIGELFKDADTYVATAGVLKAEGYYMNSSTEEYTSGSLKFTYDTTALKEKIKKEKYTKDTENWSKEWQADFDDDVFAFWGTQWFSTETDMYSTKEWSICQAPLPYFWGGTYLCPTVNLKDSEEQMRLAALFMYTICCDEQIMFTNSVLYGDVPNNKNVMDYIVDNNSVNDDRISNDNQFKIYKDALEKLDAAGF